MKRISSKVRSAISATLVNFHLFNVNKIISSSKRSDKIISFCLFGKDSIYFDNLEDCLTSYHNIFSSWKIRVYVGTDISEAAIAQMKRFDCEIYIMNCSGFDYRYTFWRFLVLDEPEISLAIIRDIDSVASIREKLMVDDWEKSGKTLHIIRDHPAHSELIMAGLWGMRINYKPQGIRRKILRFTKVNRYGIDQEFLRRIYVHFSTNALVHDIFKRQQNETPIVIPHDSNHFYVGERNIDNGDKKFHRLEIAALYQHNCNG